MRKLLSEKKINKKTVKEELSESRLISAVQLEMNEVLEQYHTSIMGLAKDDYESSKDNYGTNKIHSKKKDTLIKRIFSSFINPFTAILFVLAMVSLFTDVIFASPNERSYVTFIIITTMVVISGTLKFVQETKSGNTASKLLKMIHSTAAVERQENGKQEINIDEIVVGDIVHLSAGDMVPADMRIIEAKDLFISQSTLTGESEPVEKLSVFNSDYQSVTDLSDIAFMGSNVISGTAIGVVINISNDTLVGRISKKLNAKPIMTTFEKGVNSVSYVLIKFMLFMVPVVLCISGFTKGNWLDASLFAISVAVGLTPEMLPMIVTAALAKGANTMGKKKVIIKNLNSIQNLGSIDILCTDKTGTLTQDKVVLEYHLNVQGIEDDRVLRHAYLNSYYQTGLKNLMDIAIISKYEEINPNEINYEKIDEIPFDFNRRRMSVIVRNQQGKTQIITKGAVEEMVNCCSFTELDGKVVTLDENTKNFVSRKPVL